LERNPGVAKTSAFKLWKQAPTRFFMDAVALTVLSPPSDEPGPRPRIPRGIYDGARFDSDAFTDVIGIHNDIRNAIA
jgi:hypothetical protein